MDVGLLRIETYPIKTHTMTYSKCQDMARHGKGSETGSEGSIMKTLEYMQAGRVKP